METQRPTRAGKSVKENATCRGERAKPPHTASAARFSASSVAIGAWGYYLLLATPALIAP
jgi:hypothetical protein